MCTIFYKQFNVNDLIMEILIVSMDHMEHTKIPVYSPAMQAMNYKDLIVELV